MSKITVEVLGDKDMEWFVETAAVNMLTHEVGKPELINMENLYVLATMGAMAETAFVAKVDDKPVGALGGLLLPNLFNPDRKTLNEVFWYVLPEYRKSRAGLLLLNAYNKRAGEVADDSTMSLLATSAVNGNTLLKKGYVLQEYAYRREHERK